MKKIKLKNQLALFNAFSKAITITLLVFLIPWLVSKITIRDTDSGLIHKLDQVIELIDSLGMETYIDMEAELKAFGSYNILKDEYISIEQIQNDTLINNIQNLQRIIEAEMVDYRVLSYSIQEGGNNYLIEIGKSISTIFQFENNLKRFAFMFLGIVLILTFLFDLSFIQYLLKPFGKIVNKLKSTQHPSAFNYSSIKTSTSDFVYFNETINSLMKKIEKAFNDEREYISNVSHELLTPVSIIQSKLENIINEANLSEKDMLKIFESKKTLKRLTRLVRTLLMMSRIENEEYILTENIKMNQLIKSVLDEVEDKILAKQLGVELEFGNKEFVFKGNENLLFILFYNLINNSIRYTDEGHVKVKTSAKENQFIVEISDTGVGIAKDKIPLLFSRFKNFGNAKDSYGLGLALSKKIADYHHIKIDVESVSKNNTTEQACGTTFTLHLNDKE